MQFGFFEDEPKPQDSYIAEPKIDPEDYRKYLAWKKQQEMMYQ